MSEQEIGVLLLAVSFCFWQSWNISQFFKLRKENINLRKRLNETNNNLIDFAKGYNELLGIGKDDK